MRNRSTKTILVFFALGLISCAFCVQQAQAMGTSVITFGGGVHLADANGNSVSSVNDATQVVSWLDEGGNMPTVQSASGIFTALAGQMATFAFSWSFNSGPINAFWTVGGYTFNLIASNLVSQGNGSVFVSGRGIITGNGLHSTASWSFTVQDDPANGVFSFSGSSSIPDGGATVALLGLSLAGIEGIRRKLIKAKS